jgi:hypothetical protein
MHRKQPRTDDERPDRLPTAGTAAMASPAPHSADLVQRRQLEQSVSWSGRERLRGLWYRFRLTIAEMNYATRRMVELQAPWITDDRDDRPR